MVLIANSQSAAVRLSEALIIVHMSQKDPSASGCSSSLRGPLSFPPSLAHSLPPFVLLSSVAPWEREG